MGGLHPVPRQVPLQQSAKLSATPRRARVLRGLSRAGATPRAPDPIPHQPPPSAAGAGKNSIASAGLPLTFARSHPNPMADAANKYPENITGTFYVDDQCIDCDLCRETAPANFKRNDDGGHSYVFKQPENEEEERLSKEAMEGCPVEAIGNDGT